MTMDEAKSRTDANLRHAIAGESDPPNRTRRGARPFEC